MGTFMRMNTAYALVKTVSVKMIGFKTLKELTRRAQMRERQARIRIKIMNWLIVVLCLVIIFVGITGCVGFNG
jgi:flagellar biosynthesis/type III secretory pathway M-ring protein FliF/YscJ